MIPEEDQADTICADGDIDDGPGVTDAGTRTASTKPQAKWMAALKNRRATVAPCDIAEQGKMRPGNSTKPESNWTPSIRTVGDALPTWKILEGAALNEQRTLSTTVT